MKWSKQHSIYHLYRVLSRICGYTLSLVCIYTLDILMTNIQQLKWVTEPPPILSNVWFLFDNTEYFCPSPGLTQSIKHMHSPLFTQGTHFSFLSQKGFISLSLSRYSSARGPSRLDTTAKDIVDIRQREHTKNHDRYNNNTEKIQSNGKWKEFTFKLCL